jgi:3-deoxy-D-manno-octulosonate 8-phosphate phosphatase (KDO 8-P phosphatase)
MKNLSEIDFSKITFVLMDCDGVLTDGTIIYSSTGEMLKAFHAHDGYGIERGHQLGLRFAIISGRYAKENEFRAAKLKISELYQNVKDKVAACEEIKTKYNLSDENLCFVGDDAFDLPLLRKVAFSCAPPEAVPEVKDEVDYITKVHAGKGCVREVIDLILKHQKKI